MGNRNTYRRRLDIDRPSRPISRWVQNAGTPRIAWRGIDGACATKEVSGGRGAIIEFEEDVDAALLKHDGLPDGVRPLEMDFSRDALQKLPDWETAGFNEAAIRANKRALGHYHGTVQSDAKADLTLQITASAPPAVHGGDAPHAGWKGISGAPVILAASSRIVAVLRNVPDSHENRVLVAVPVRRLIELERFKEAISQPNKEEIRRAFIERIKPLTANRKAMAEMVAFGVQADLNDETRAGKLLECDPAQFFAKMHELVSGDLLDPDTRSHLERMLLELAPPLMHSAASATANW